MTTSTYVVLLSSDVTQETTHGGIVTDNDKRTAEALGKLIEDLDGLMFPDHPINVMVLMDHYRDQDQAHARFYYDPEIDKEYYRIFGTEVYAFCHRIMGEHEHYTFQDALLWITAYAVRQRIQSTADFRLITPDDTDVQPPYSAYNFDASYVAAYAVQQLNQGFGRAWEEMMELMLLNPQTLAERTQKTIG